MVSPAFQEFPGYARNPVLIHCPWGSPYSLPLPTVAKGGRPWRQTQPYPRPQGESGLSIPSLRLWICPWPFPHIVMIGELLSFYTLNLSCAQNFSFVFLPLYPLSLCWNIPLITSRIYITHRVMLCLFLWISYSALTPTPPVPPSPWNGIFSWISTPCLELYYCEDIFQMSCRFLWVTQHFLEFPLACSVHLSNAPFQLSTFILPTAPLLAANLTYSAPGPSSCVLHVLYSSCLLVSPIPEWNVRIFLFCVVSFLFTHIGNYLRMGPRFANFFISGV